jgi:hypothetical protein
LELAREREFLEARHEFELALADDPPLDAHFGLGQVQLALGEPCLALAAYEDYLRLGGERIPSDKRLRLERHVRQLRKNAASAHGCGSDSAQGRIHILCVSSKMEMSLDGRLVANVSEEGLVVEPGEHRIQFSDPSGEWTPTFVEVPPGGEVSVVCAKNSLLSGKSAAGSNAQRTSPLTTSQSVALGVTGAGFGLGIAALSQYFWNRGRHDVYLTQRDRLLIEGGTPAEIQEYNALGLSIEKANKVSVGLGVASAVVTGVGITWFVLSTKKRSRRTPTSSALSPHGQARFLHSSEIMIRGTSLSWSGAW